MKISFSGAHRVGKTSLAERVAVENDLIMYYTNVSGVFKDKSVQFYEKELTGRQGFYMRLKRQQEILEHVIQGIRKGEPWSVYDRSPLDVAVYSELFLSELLKTFDPNPATFKCFHDHLNGMGKYLKEIDFYFIVQPGVKFVSDEKSCSPNTQEDFNDILLNWIERIPKDKYFVIDRDMLDFEERVTACNTVFRYFAKN